MARIPPAAGQLYNPRWRLLEDTDLNRMVNELTQQRLFPISVFAYGSLIWDPGFAVQSRRRATALGWHRSFSISLDHFRGTPERPGLMLALASGGSCEGFFSRLHCKLRCNRYGLYCVTSLLPMNWLKSEFMMCISGNYRGL